MDWQRTVGARLGDAICLLAAVVFLQNGSGYHSRLPLLDFSSWVPPYTYRKQTLKRQQKTKLKQYGNAAKHD